MIHAKYGSSQCSTYRKKLETNKLFMNCPHPCLPLSPWFWVLAASLATAMESAENEAG